MEIVKLEKEQTDNIIIEGDADRNRESGCSPEKTY